MKISTLKKFQDFPDFSRICSTNPGQVQKTMANYSTLTHLITASIHWVHHAANCLHY